MLLAAVGSTTARVGDVLEVLQRLVAERLDELRAQTSTYPGVDALLARLAEAGIRQTVVTGNIAAIARHKLDAGSLIPPIAPDFGGYGAAPRIAPRSPGWQSTACPRPGGIRVLTKCGSSEIRHATSPAPVRWACIARSWPPGGAPSRS